MMKHSGVEKLHIFQHPLNSCAEKIIPNNAEIKTQMDHRIAMSFLIMGMAANSPIHIDDGDFIKSSFPNFIDNMNKLGGKISKKI